jgi:hypothetical protein
LAEAERLVESIAELGSLALGVEALVECVLELGVIAETLAVASAAGDVLRVGPALGDTAWRMLLAGCQEDPKKERHTELFTGSRALGDRSCGCANDGEGES